MEIRHLPYILDPAASRFQFYENHWKSVSLHVLGRHMAPKGKTMLDYGCGRGETLKLAAEMGFVPLGTDVDSECVRLAEAYGPAVTLDPNDPVTQFGEKSFDVVSCFHVLEHVDCPKKTLNDLRKIARNYVVLAVPNLRYLHQLMARRIELSAINEGHLQSWDHWHLRNLAERHCGLQLVEWGFDATILPVLSAVSQRLLGSKTTIRLETGIFRKIFPFHCVSVIGLFRVR